MWAYYYVSQVQHRDDLPQAAERAQMSLLRYAAAGAAKCPQCGSRFIRHFGSGTELVAEELLKLWPWLKVVRMDRDTTQNKNAHQQILETFAKGEAQVLIGTQMVTKGLVFPMVTLVGSHCSRSDAQQPVIRRAERASSC